MTRSQATDTKASI